MFVFRKVISIVVVVTPTIAYAADMPWETGPVVIGERGARDVEIGTGWYLRGDIGYAKSTTPKLSYTDTTTTLGNPKVADPMTFGVGFGYKFDMFRADLTIDAINRRKISWDRLAGCYGWSCSTGFDRMNSGRQTITTVLANVYADLGNWGGLTPYVGAGIGVAYGGTSIDGYVSPNITSAVPSDVYTNYSYKTESKNGFSLAAAGMAGASYTLGDGLMLDLGYRYLWVASSQSGRTAYKSTTVTNPDKNGQGGGTTSFEGIARGRLRAENLGFHQFRVGLRYFVN